MFDERSRYALKGMFASTVFLSWLGTHARLLYTDQRMLYKFVRAVRIGKMKIYESGGKKLSSGDWWCIHSKPNLVATLIILSNKILVILTSAKLNVKDKEEDRNKDEREKEKRGVHAQGWYNRKKRSVKQRQSARNWTSLRLVLT